MGWLWSSGAAPAPKNGDVPAATSHQTATRQPAPPAADPAAAVTNSDGVDPEIVKFMAQLQAEFGGSNSNSSRNNNTPAVAAPETSTPSSSWRPSRNKSTSSQPPSPHSHPQSSSPSSRPEPPRPARLDPVSESLLPTTMSCRQAFDQAFHCNSLGGQWTAVYRAGAMRSCSEQWDDFWFCMRARAYAAPAREEAIRDHYRRRELKKYGPGMPSSTDVWEPRTERLPVGSVFQERYEKPDISDEEWRRHEIEHRRMVQRMLREEEERKSASG
ncbi:hypothetical protein F4802DRAFT_601127 [Xylaria palmicola]|nr:hypothetical protein F4802DRAFT_601127 [Xylaria palmicola]